MVKNRRLWFSASFIGQDVRAKFAPADFTVSPAVHFLSPAPESEQSQRNHVTRGKSAFRVSSAGPNKAICIVIPLKTLRRSMRTPYFTRRFLFSGLPGLGRVVAFSGWVRSTTGGDSPASQLSHSSQVTAASEPQNTSG